MMYFINGKFLSQLTTGTQRYAIEITKELLSEGLTNIKLIVPRGTDLPAWLPSNVVRFAGSRGVLFDQFSVPWLSRKGVLLSLSGPLSLFHHNQWHVIHDIGFLKYKDHYSLAFRLFYALMYWWSAKTSSELVTVSNFSANAIRDHYKLSEDREVHVIPGAGEHMCNLVATRPDRELPERYFLLVGSPTRRKNTRRALQILAKANVDAVVVGWGEDIGNIQSERPHPLITPVTGIADSELKWLYQQADALLVPSLYEGFGLPVLEAQWSDAIVIANRRAALPEVLGRSGVLVDFDDDIEVLTAISACNSNRMQAKQLEQLVRNRARYSWSNSAKKFLELMVRP
jgi:glycosyltransferase involved in cell wall biosynthesis